MVAWTRGWQQRGERLADLDGILKLRGPGKCEGQLPVDGGAFSWGHCGFMTRRCTCGACQGWKGRAKNREGGVQR